MKKEYLLGSGAIAAACLASCCVKPEDLVPPTPEHDAEFAEAINAMRSQDLECRQNMAGEMTVGPSVVKMIRRDRERIREAQVKRDRKAAKRMGISLEEYLARNR